MPYLLWNLIGIAIVLIERSPLLAPYFPGLSAKTLDLKFFIDCFWRYGQYNTTFFDNGGMPIDYPLWFIRNLIILCIISPIIYLMLKKLKVLAPIALSTLFIAGCWPQIDGFSLTGVLFFTIGSYLSMNIRFFKYLFISGPPIIALWIIFMALDLYTLNQSASNHIFHALSILSGVAAVLYIGHQCCLRKIHMPKFLTNSAFFVYAFHGLIVHTLKIGAVRIIQPTNELQWAAIYFGVFAMLLASSVGFAYILKKIAPRTTKILCGGR